MRKQLTIAISIIIIFMMHGCTIRSSFYIVNRSDKQLTVKYEVVKSDNNQFNLFNTNPRTFKIDKDKYDLTTLEEESTNSSFDTLSMTITILLNSNQALDIGSSRYFKKHDIARKEIFSNIKRLQIITDKDTLDCSGDLIPDLFEVNDSECTITKY